MLHQGAILCGLHACCMLMVARGEKQQKRLCCPRMVTGAFLLYSTPQDADFVCNTESVLDSDGSRLRVPEKSCETWQDSSGTSGMLWTAMAIAMTGPILTKDEKATCRQTQCTSADCLTEDGNHIRSACRATFDC